MPYLPQPVRAPAFAAHRAMRRFAKPAPVEKPVRRKRARDVAMIGTDSPAAAVPMMAAPDSEN